MDDIEKKLTKYIRTFSAAAGLGSSIVISVIYSMSAAYVSAALRPAEDRIQVIEVKIEAHSEYAEKEFQDLELYKDKVNYVYYRVPRGTLIEESE